MKRGLKLSLLSFLLIIVALLIWYFEPGQGIEDLKEKYLYEESAFINIDGLDIHYRITGVGKPLILMHGVASSLHTWEGWHDALSGEYQVISLDVPAFALTGPFPDGDYSTEHYMEVLTAFMDSLDIESCYMGGNSFGGYLTWNMALHQPDRIEKIMLLNAGGFPRKMKNIDLGFYISKAKWSAWFVHYFTPRPLVSRSVKHAYFDESRIKEGTVDRYYDMLTRDGVRQAFTQVLRALENLEDPTEQLKQIQQPTLIIWGHDDGIIPVENAEQFQSAIPNAQLIIFESGHIPMEENPKETAEVALQFLQNGTL